ncbi:unnamed protein product [Paramecium sonneborni]|uniref:Uncharacterized protein n=1 Tax=Paramecium sonneborni TaxID=65129 RepID=A0A8S1QN50_9CILI|nr:unnamed protein product [Paramecium sonneborni]
MFACSNDSRLKLDETKKNFVIKELVLQHHLFLFLIYSKFLQFEDKIHSEDGKLLDLLSEIKFIELSDSKPQMNTFQINNDESVKLRYALSYQMIQIIHKYHIQYI